MGYERNDRRYDRDYRGEYDRAGYGRDSYGRGEDPRDRGFFERAGDEVRSWFGDEEAERRRLRDERYDERGDREGGRFAYGDAGGYRSPDRYPSWARSNQGDHPRGLGRPSYSGVRYDRTDEGRQFDDGGYARDAYGYGESDYGAGYGGDRDRDYRAAYRARQSQRGYADDHTDYSDWRNRQISAFDRDYDEYRRENRSRFESEFATWRQARQTQRDSLTSVKEHQEVVGSDGQHVGTVDHVRSDHILLTKTDRDAGGHHHAIPSSWIETVADKVTLKRTAAEAKRAWQDAEERGGLFGGERPGRDGETGRGQLDRSFTGTY